MSEDSRGEILICIPTYNERENVEPIVSAVLEVLPAAHVLVIDDASPDGTGEIADRLAREDDRVHVMHRTAKEGLGKAYLAGFAWALEREYRYVIEFDADFSHDPAHLPAMVERLAGGADVVVGSRRVPGGGAKDWPVSRRLISFAGSVYARTVLGVDVRDLTGGFNGFRRRALERLDLARVSTSGYGFQIEMKYRAIMAGLNVVEIPIVFRDRREGVSKMNKAIFVEAMVQVLRLRAESILGSDRGRDAP